MSGGRFDFDDGGTYCGGWEEGKAHGHGVCTGPKGQGEYSGAWHYGFEVSGVYTWPSGNTYEGQWQNGKRHGLGVERRGRWMYRGEWTQGYKGRYGSRHSANSQAKYEGTWSSGLQDGYGTETYADGGVYQGQWLRGMRHGYGIRRSAPYGVAAKYRSRSHAHASLTSLRSEQGEDVPAGAPPASDAKDAQKSAAVDDSRGGFVLRARSEPPSRRRSLSVQSVKILSRLRIKKQRSTGDLNQRVAGTGSLRSSGSTNSCTSDESAYTGYSGGHHGHALPPEEFVDPQVTENYMGEWKNDKRSGFGVSERSDGLKYEGEWFNNKKFGYGVTTLKEGVKEEGKYKNNYLVTSQKKRHLLFVRSSKLRERIDSAVAAANRAAQIAAQKADIAISRTATARDRAEQADVSSGQAEEDSGVARLQAKQFDPNFRQPGTDLLKRRIQEPNHVPFESPAPRAPAAANPHIRSNSLFNPKSHRTYDHEDELLTPPMVTPPSEMPPDAQRTAPAGYRSGAAASPAFPASPVAQPAQSSLYTTVDRHPPPSGAQMGYREGGEPLPHPTSLQLNPTHGGAGLQMQQPSVASQTQVSLQGAPMQGEQLMQSRNPAPHLLATPPNATGPRQFSDERAGQLGAHPQHGAQYYDEGMAMGASPSMTPSQASSRQSINIVNDHFDQYAMISNPTAQRMHQLNLQKTAPVGAGGNTPPSASGSGATAGSGGARVPDTSSEIVHTGLTRRSTLATPKDWQALQAFDKTNPPLRGAGGTTPTGPGLGGGGLSQAEMEERGSLPDVHVLGTGSVTLTREEASRMSSQRRQELQRIAEEQELLRSNPLRYIFHPAVRAWIVRWKLPLLVLLVNLCLSLIFYQLLNNQTAQDDDSADNREDS